MRLLASLAVAALVGLVPTARANQLPEPKGALAVQVTVTDGQIAIVETFEGGPAAKAGLKPGDVFVQVGDHKVKDKDATQDDLQEMVKEIIKHEAGTKLKIKVKRDGKEMTVEATLAKPGEFLPKKDG